MTDFSNHTNDELAEDGMAWIVETEARANAISPVTPELTTLRRELAKIHLHMSLALVASNGGGHTSFNGGDKEPPSGP